MPDDTVASCAKMAEPLEMQFGLWSQVDRRKHACITWEHIGTIWRIQLNRPCAAAMRPYVKSLRPLVLLPTDTDTNRLADSDNQSTLYVQDP